MSDSTTITSTGMGGDQPYVLVTIEDQSFRHVLERSEITIGRGSSCELRLEHASVSRQHARISFDGQRAFLEDLGSHNGTRINGAIVSAPSEVVSGDVISVGDGTLVVYLAPQASRRVLASDIVERLSSEVDRAMRYDDTVALIAWQIDAPPSGIAALLAPFLRGCDAIGVTSDGTLLGVCPGLDCDAALDLAQRTHVALRELRPDARAAVTMCPADACDTTTLLLAARDAIAAANGDLGRPDIAACRIELPDATAVVADPGMRRAYDLVRRLAGSEMPVLITGETGVGKELAARALHGWSPRASGPFVVVNCAALPENLVESELFGHRRGAFTSADRDKQGLFATASGGTLFLDELGELSLAVQAKLLRAVETRTITPVGATESITVDIRIVAATNRDLAAEVKAERFRSDLYYRLGAAVVVLPPLRDRPRDIPALARTLLARATARLGRGPTAISDGAMRVLVERRYPGNVRELANVMDYAAAISEGNTLLAADLPGEHGDPALPRTRTIGAEIEALERQRMGEALAACQGNQSRAADMIGMPRRTFVTKLGKYKLR